MGGVLPSFDFFDIYKFGEVPRSSDDGGREVDLEAPVEADLHVEAEEDEYLDEVDNEVDVDTSVDFVNKNKLTPRGGKRVKVTLPRGLRLKRQTSANRFFGYGRRWYWLNNNNDGRTCYAALPGNVTQTAKDLQKKPK